MQGRHGEQANGPSPFGFTNGLTTKKWNVVSDHYDEKRSVMLSRTNTTIRRAVVMDHYHEKIVFDGMLSRTTSTKKMYAVVDHFPSCFMLSVLFHI